MAFNMLLGWVNFWCNLHFRVSVLTTCTTMLCPFLWRRLKWWYQPDGTKTDLCFPKGCSYSSLQLTDLDNTNPIKTAHLGLREVLVKRQGPNFVVDLICTGSHGHEWRAVNETVQEVENGSFHPENLFWFFLQSDSSAIADRLGVKSLLVHCRTCQPESFWHQVRMTETPSYRSVTGWRRVLWWTQIQLQGSVGLTLTGNSWCLLLWMKTFWLCCSGCYHSDLNLNEQKSRNGCIQCINI